MADVTLNPGTGGSVVHTVTRTGKETQVVGLDLTPGGGSETLMNGSMPITAAALPLPAGAATAAKQPALGTAGSASPDVITVQGAASMTAVKTDGSGVTQPVSGPLTDAQLRASTVPVSGTVTATGPLTDTQLRASAVPVSVVAGVADNSVGLPATALVVQGYDGTNTQVLATNAAGNLQVGLSAGIPAGANAIGSVTVTGTPAVDTELPAAAALADGAANPTTPTVGAGVLLWNGSTWDRAPGGATNGLTTNLKALNGATVDTSSGNKSGGTLRVTLATDQVQLTNALKVDPSGVTSPVSLASLPSLAAGSALAARVNVDPQTANGLSIFHLVSAATTNATNIKASGGQVYGWYIYNSNAAARKVVFHNTAGTPTAGASVIFALVIPPNSAANAPMDMGLTFATGIAITTVTGLTDADAVAVAANDLIINIFYK